MRIESYVDQTLKSLLDMPVVETTFATAPCFACVHIDSQGNRTEDLIFTSVDDPECEKKLRDWITKETSKPTKRTGISSRAFVRHENPVFEDIHAARSVLLSEVLSSDRNPTSKAKRDVVSYMGRALDMQTGQDKRLFGKKGSMLSRLRYGLGDNDPWFVMYSTKLHHYFNATKHGDRRVHEMDRRSLTSGDGKLICAAFFEAVRLFFVWYLGEKGASHPDLAQINYHVAGLNISLPSPVGMK